MIQLDFQNINKDKKFILIGIFVWIIAAFIINPCGNFSLNDDWAYALSVEKWVETGSFVHGDWPAMTLYGHSFFGLLVSKIFGFSLTYLRLLVVFLGAIGLWGTYQLISQTSQNKNIAFFSILVLGFSPIYLSLSFTFMTDISFYVFLVWSSVFYAKTFRSQSIKMLIIATALAVFAVLIRQLGVLPPLAFGIAVIASKISSTKIKVFGIFSFGVTLATLLFFNWWLEVSQGLPEYYGNASVIWKQITDKQTLQQIYERASSLSMHWGLFLLPVVIISFMQAIKRIKIKPAIIITLVTFGISSSIFFVWDFFPTGNIFNGNYIGPRLLKDVYYGAEIFPKLSPSNLIILRSIASAGAVMLIFTVLANVFSVFKKVKTSQIKQVQEIKLFVLLLFLGYTFLISINAYYFDRYYIQALPFVVILVLPYGFFSTKKWVLAVASVFFIAQSVFSVAGTHDYLAWNRAKNMAISHLTDSLNVSPKNIDAGFEFNSYHKLVERNYNENQGNSWWFVNNDNYIVSFRPWASYEKVKAFGYYSSIRQENDSIWISKRRKDRKFVSLKCDIDSIDFETKTMFTSNKNIPIELPAIIDSSFSRSGKFSIKTTPQAPYALTYKTKDASNHMKYNISVWRYPAEKGASICVSIEDNNYFKADGENVIEKDLAGWEKIQFQGVLPSDAKGKEVVFFVCNFSDSTTVWLDDFEMKLEDY